MPISISYRRIHLPKTVVIKTGHRSVQWTPQRISISYHRLKTAVIQKPSIVEREMSTIPRSNSDDKLWVYPSEQMFFNAMKRKNWDPDEKDMAVVVPIHNAVNEMAWQKILEWERLHTTECNQPRLEKFEGKPKDITPKARLRSFFGYALPFDRHDWVVDRCGQKVTYVIDFYTGKQDPNKPMSLSFYLDVRPALTPTGLWDRLRMSFRKGQFM
ncbi:cytochrome c/c1 heme lyase-domain-containing protein [Mycotypha africana]|uniref:cytochrome c/c1 heme lyase-domain-containing protein n=1 Tax=Mycotypha africana TaxID=64632 RepID=UPI002301B6C1|nr:cytochrome c/c1 heme lyase-domain-containing protein [Mycotypha africana]KAI8981648.1 cytochrome c/c1 heme lyase-domain-containing protein [Mycotypha africana]